MRYNTYLGRFILTAIIAIVVSTTSIPLNAYASSNEIPKIDKEIEFFMSKGYINDSVINELNQNIQKEDDTYLKYSQANRFYQSSEQMEKEQIENILRNLSELTSDNIYRVVDLNENQQIVFYTNGYFTVDELQQYPLVTSNAKKSGINYKSASNSKKFYAEKASIKVQVADVKISARFSYGDGRADVEEITGFEYNTIPFISIDGGQTGSESFDGGAGARAYNRGALVASGAYKFVSGNLYRNPFDVRVSVTSDGKVWRN